MKDVLLAYLKNKAFIGGIIMIFFYQLIMVPVYIGGYSAIPKNVTELTVAIVNEDAGAGEIAEQLKTQLPFKVESSLTLEQAKQKLEDKDISMVVHIPADFSQNAAVTENQVQLDIMINQAVPSMVSTTMQSAANEISAQLSKQLQGNSMIGFLNGMQVPLEQAEALTDQALNKVNANIVISHAMPQGMHNTMAPMYLTMAAYSGVMVYSMIASQTLGSIRQKHGKWKSFLGLQGLTLVASILAPLIGVGLYFLTQGGYGAAAFFEIWGTHALEIYAAFQVTSIFTMLLGAGGMMINLPLILIQSISSGTIMPQAMMTGFYKFFSHISVVYHTAQADYSTLFGGGDVLHSIGMVVLIGGVALLINMATHQFKPNKVKNNDNTTKDALAPVSA